MHGETADGLCSDSGVEISRGITFWLWTRKLQWTQRKGSGHESQDRKTVIEWMWLVDSYGELKVIGWRLWSNESYFFIWLNEYDSGQLWLNECDWLTVGVSQRRVAAEVWGGDWTQGESAVDSHLLPHCCARLLGQAGHQETGHTLQILCEFPSSVSSSGFPLSLPVSRFFSFIVQGVCLLSYSWNYTEWQKRTCLHMLKIWGQLKIEEEYWKFPAGQVKSCMNRQC